MKQYLELIAQKSTLSQQEAWWLLEHISNKSRTQLLVLNNLTDAEILKLDQALVQLSQQHKPLAYLLGLVPFLDLAIQTQAPILIPRHETEEWVFNLIEQLKPMEQEIETILDLGTGSGCIALALAKHFPKAHVTAVDINPQALDLAKHNAKLNNIENITFIESDLFEEIRKHLDPEACSSKLFAKAETSQGRKEPILCPNGYDLIVSNPPYISPTFEQTLTPQVLNWEDHRALFACDQGMTIIKQILQQSAQFLTANNKLPVQLVIEMDHDQKDNMVNFAQKKNWTAQAHKDSFGKWRTLWCKKT